MRTKQLEELLKEKCLVLNTQIQELLTSFQRPENYWEYIGILAKTEEKLLDVKNLLTQTTKLCEDAAVE